MVVNNVYLMQLIYKSQFSRLEISKRNEKKKKSIEKLVVLFKIQLYNLK